jgi:hypothetical protein
VSVISAERHWWHDRGNRLWLLGTLCAVALGFVPWMISTQEQPPIYYPNTPFPVLINPVRPGDTLVLFIRRCNSTDREMPYTFVRNLVRVDQPGQYITSTLPSGGSFLETGPGCEEVRSQTNIIPPDTPPGEYVLRATTIVSGKWKTFYVPWASQPFTVVE